MEESRDANDRFVFKTARPEGRPWVEESGVRGRGCLGFFLMDKPVKTISPGEGDPAEQERAMDVERSIEMF